MSENEDNSMANLFRLMRPKNICICKAVSEAKLVDTIHSGAHTIEELVFRTDASTKCGSCSQQVRSILQRELSKIEMEEKSTS